MKAPNTNQKNQSETKYINSSAINHRVKCLIRDIEDYNGFVNEGPKPRGLEVKEDLMTTINLDPLFPCMNFKARKFNYKYLAGEIAWYLLKSRETTFIDKFSSFWGNIKNEDGTINSNYGNLLLTSTEEHTSQMAWVVNTLKADKDSRQAIAYIGGKQFQYSGNKDFVCTQYLNFFIRYNTLYMKVQMRSNDIFYGLSYDAPWFSTVLQNTWMELKETYPDLEMGVYYHASDNTHYYKRHFEVAAKIANEDLSPKDDIKLELKEPLWYTTEDGHTTLSMNAAKYIKWFDNKLENIDKLETSDFIEALSIIYNIRK